MTETTNIVLTAEAVQQIRDAIVQTLEEEYGATPEPGADDALISDLDRPAVERLRGALRRLGGALMVAVLVLWADPAGAPILCPDPETGEYGPEHCDLVEPIERHPLAVECGFLDMFAAERVDPICADYWAQEEPALVLQVLHEQRQRELAPED